MGGSRSNLSILYVGVPDRTCLQRAEALRGLGHQVQHVIAGPPRNRPKFQLYRITNKLRRPADLHGANRKIISSLQRGRFDLLWIDKGLTISASSLRQVKDRHPGVQIIGYSQMT